MTKTYKSNPAILNELRDYIDGLMLSDGNIQVRNDLNGRYRQGCKYKGWLDLISKDLYEYGVNSKVDYGYLSLYGFSPKCGSVIYSINTSRYIEFKEMYDRFYVKWYDIDKYPKIRWHKDEGGEYFIWKKIVPKDICLSPVCVANWYIGDGSFTKYKHQNGCRIELATNGFLRDDAIFLSDLLSDVLNIKCNVDKVGRIMIYSESGSMIFLNYIKGYKVDCYSYKFPEV